MGTYHLQIDFMENYWAISEYPSAIKRGWLENHPLTEVLMGNHLEMGGYSIATDWLKMILYVPDWKSTTCGIYRKYK
jgi:hypothetical protein